jgi:PAS domain S-box-containing protein
MFKIRSARRQALLAGLVLLVLLSATVAVALRSAQYDQDRQAAVAQRITVATALGDARAQFFIGATQLLIAAFADDPAPFVDSYRSTVPPVNDDLRQAREALAILNESDGVALLNETATDIEQIQQAIEGFLPTNLTDDRDTRLGLVIQYIPQMWPDAQTMMGNLEQLANGERSKLTAEQAAADQSSQTTLGLLIGLSTLASLVAFAILGIFIVSLLRPLSSLQASVKAITSGDWSVRAKVFGLEETASLAHDFNEMTDTLVERSAQLQESEQRFRNVLDVSRDFIYKLNLPDRAYEYVSPSVLPMSGFTPEEFAAMGFAGVLERFHPEDRERLQSYIERYQDNTLEDDEVTTIEYRWKRKDGEYYWLSDSAALVRDADGKPVALVGSARDVTAQKQAEEALRESEARYKALFAGAPEGMLVADLQTKQFRHANPAMCRMFGYTEEEFLRIGVADIHPKESLSYVLAEFEAQARGEKLLSAGLPCQRKDGSLFYANVNAVKVALDGRRCNVGFFTDVTENRQAEAALRESEQRFRQVLEVSSDVIYWLNLESNTYEYVSPSVLPMSGFTPEEFAGLGVRGVRHRVHPEDWPQYKQEIDELLAHGARARAASQWESRWQCKDGEYRWFSESRALVRGEDGRSLALVGTIRDVTESKKAEETLRKSEERHRVLFETIPQGIVYQSADGAIISANPAAERILGLTIDQMQGRTSVDPRWKAIHEDGSDFPGETHASMVALKTGRKVLNVVMGVYNPKDDSHRWININATPLFRPGENKPHQVYTTFEDITERKMAEKTLRESDERFRQVLDVSSDLIYKLNLQTRSYDYISPSVRQLVGFAPEEIVAMGLEGVRERFHPDDKEGFRTHPSRLPDHTVEGREPPTIEYRWQCKDGEYRWLSDNRAFVLDDDGRALALVGTVRDISERRLAEEKKQKAFESVMMLLATAAEARDPYTERHLQRIRGYSEAIARELGLPPDEVRDIGLASLLHDLGKMRVPDFILTKPAPLSEEEWEVMKQHPLWGEELLSTHPWLETARQIARWHHENWDGTGYPDGLRGDEIPLSAAIVAIADSLDAMTSDRPYKKAWPSPRAIKEIRAQSGQRYSPEVVEAFNRALRTGEIKRVATSADSGLLSDLSEAA